MQISYLNSNLFLFFIRWRKAKTATLTLTLTFDSGGEVIGGKYLEKKNIIFWKRKTEKKGGK